MNRSQLEHIIRAASGIVGEPDIVVVGSQAILAQFPMAPKALLVSMEADVYPRHRPDLSIQVDGAIGERSLFHETFGFYAHGVAQNTATLPNGWEERLIPIHNANTGGGTGWCLEVHDLAASKLVAGREKDVGFVSILVKEKMIERATMDQRIAALPLQLERTTEIFQRFNRIKD